MALPDQDLATLGDIRIKVRRLTRSPSATQLTNDQIDDYVNNFILYDFPEFINKRNLTFYTQPNVERYQTNDIAEDNPLYNFKNIYLGIESPIYVDGEEVWFSTSEENFYGTFPLEYTTTTVGIGDGIEVDFDGTLTNLPMLHGEVKFFSKDVDNYSVILIDDVNVDPVTGVDTQEGDLLDQNTLNDQGDINYLTGVFDINFAGHPPAAGEPVYASYVPYTASKPTSVLFHNNGFNFRPVPDRAYKVSVTAFVRPTELLVANDEPLLAQWWQYIAYGAAKKVFEDRMDMESVQMIMPELSRQRLQMQRREIIQDSIRRVPTIYAWNDVNKSQSRT